MASVSEVCHLTCHLEPIGVSVWELSLLCPGLVCRQTSLPRHPKPSVFLSPGEITRSHLRCFPQAPPLACGLRLQQAGPKISSNKYQFADTLYPTETCPAWPIPVFSCSFQVPGNGDQAPALVIQAPRMYCHPE